MKQRARTEERYDTSQLTLGNRGRSSNRDYIAHCFRWGWAKRHVAAANKRFAAAGRGGCRVLDVGCGRDMPLCRELQSFASSVPAAYVGVDVNEISNPDGHSWVEAVGEFDFATRWPELVAACSTEGGLFDLVVSFESVEHMRREDGLRLLEGCRACLAPGGTFLLSTPVFNGRAAAAHLHEWTVPELAAALDAEGFEVADRFGTFASYPDIKAAAAPELLAALDRAREFYSDDVMACFLAPLYPDASRNCAWVCRAKEVPCPT